MSQETTKKVEKFGCWWKVINGPNNSRILISNEDFTKDEAKEIANQFLTRHPSLAPIPPFGPGQSGLVSFKLGKEEIWTYMYWELHLSISFDLPQKDGKKIRTNDLSSLPQGKSVVDM